MQFRFAAGVSHDLRTPLTAFRGAAFNLVDGLVTEPAGSATPNSSCATLKNSRR